jgi:hypothetical protein
MQLMQLLQRVSPVDIRLTVEPKQRPHRFEVDAKQSAPTSWEIDFSTTHSPWLNGRTIMRS